jgi:hypothetical protein
MRITYGMKGTRFMLVQYMLLNSFDYADAYVATDMFSYNFCRTQVL